VTEISFDSNPSHSLVLFTRPEVGHPWRERDVCRLFLGKKRISRRVIE